MTLEGILIMFCKHFIKVFI